MEKRQREVNSLMEELMRTTVDADKNRGMSDVDIFKGVTKNLVVNALKTLDETEGLWEIDHTSTELREQFHLLRHYLDYLRRFCEGKV